ncbi:uncharacterized protein STEHIDRAFT_163515 [Stereum hirsutum FP-91666 SS1]|uniref:Uncharacterized protein n=1 Tax=Stereum hirsutum (strain FP-91666) TaxID=721885 RepID=R7RY16_STEHR|nr:uncharacterized protein STEHIDRAFT_163515 [Stereum hirsutum FP-91666 SS1]EIM79693.1 hypothetical protein STEHIDRAFT_163515 [Stereum hirsutum FP-91666 SS1]
MLFSITKAVFATLALGVAMTSAAPTPTNAVSRRTNATGVDAVKTHAANVKSGCDHLSGLSPKEAADPTMVTTIVVSINAELEAVKSACQGSSSGDSSDLIDIMVDLVAEITSAVNKCKETSKNDPTIIAILAKIDISLSGLLTAITNLVSTLLNDIDNLLSGLLGGGVTDSLWGCGFKKSYNVLVHIGLSIGINL